MSLTGCETGPKSGRVAYDCERGPGLIVIFERERARMFVGGGSPIHLERRRSRTGFWYESATHSIRGQGRRLDLTVGRMMPIRCTARSASRR